MLIAGFNRGAEAGSLPLSVRALEAGLRHLINVGIDDVHLTVAIKFFWPRKLRLNKNKLFSFSAVRHFPAYYLDFGPQRVLEPRAAVSMMAG